MGSCTTSYPSSSPRPPLHNLCASGSQCPLLYASQPLFLADAAICVSSLENGVLLLAPLASTGCVGKNLSGNPNRTSTAELNKRLGDLTTSLSTIKFNHLLGHSQSVSAGFVSTLETLPQLRMNKCGCNIRGCLKSFEKSDFMPTA